MKQQLKNILLPFLTSRPITAIATHLFGSGIPIFTLHRMATDKLPSRGHSPEFLRQSLQLLKDNGHTFISLEDILAATRGEIELPPKPVAFTIDDGFYDQASIAAPIFLEFNCPVTFYLITGLVDMESWPWVSQVSYLVENARTDVIRLDIPNNKLEFSISGNKQNSLADRSIRETLKYLDDDLIQSIIEQLSHETQVSLPSTPPEEYSPLTWDTARELERKGISFGPHTVSHPILSKVNNRQSEHEIADSWKRIKQELTNPVPIFCYPNGRTCDYGVREIEFIRKAGLIGAVSTIPEQVDMNNQSDQYEFNLPRLGFPTSLQDLIQYSTWIEHAKNSIRN